MATPCPDPAGAASDQLRAAHLDDDDLGRQMLVLMSTDPTREWRGVDLVSMAHADPVTAIVCLAELVHDGLLERVAPGRYRLAAPPLQRKLHGLPHGE